jgi:hypothetical protein
MRGDRDDGRSVGGIALTARGLTFGAGPSNSTLDRPRASLPVTTRRIALSSLAISSPDGTLRCWASRH